MGAIRLGASLATVERLMELPCDEKTPTLCRYHARAVEFQFDGEGKLKRIIAHRQARRAGDKTYGLFNGAIPPDLMFGMIPAAIQQHLGPPERVVEGHEGAAPEAFQPGDIVTAVNGIPVDSVARGQQIVESLGTAGSARVTVRRGGVPTEVDVKLRD